MFNLLFKTNDTVFFFLINWSISNLNFADNNQKKCPEETDVMPFCRQMALGGECSRDPMYMWDHCRRSCGFGEFLLENSDYGI